MSDIISWELLCVWCLLWD